MHSEQCSDRRPGRWRAAVALSALVLAALCWRAAAGAGAVPTARPRRPSDTGARLQAQEPAGGVRSAASLPDELVGSWSADDPQGVGSWTIAFSADGRYDQSNPLRGISVGGQAAVAGRKLYLQPEDADSQTYVWQITGERLRLDDHVYRRTAGVADALVGSWADAGGALQTLTFNSDGTYDVADATGSVSHSTYSVVGDRLSAGRSTYTWSVAGAQLQLRLPDGRVLTYSRTA